ncbi:unnamed protein product [Allacma fusca]|uniref:LTD domain-containing protein n=1 Tax=Allacma fusca TaxID=39272 RepID=A0A8J2NVW6_9HEXA|nr:unnamed protein product [Allacma fusca]
MYPVQVESERRRLRRLNHIGNLSYHRISDVERSKGTNEVEVLKQKLEKKTKEAATAQARVRQLCDRFQSSVEHERKELETDVTRLKRELQLLRGHLEQEKSSRKLLEDKLDSKEQELSFQNRCHEQEVALIKACHSREIQEVRELLFKENELKLNQRSQNLHAEFETQLQVEKKEMHDFYGQKVSVLTSQLQALESSSKSKGQELAWLSSRCDSQTKKISDIESEKNNLMIKWKDFEAKVDGDRTKFLALLEDRQREINVLTSEKSALIMDNQNLVRTKLTLETEIASYRELLERVNRRLSCSPPRSVVKNDESCRENMILPQETNCKRKYSEDEKDTDSGTNMISHGVVEISEDDPHGGFIQIRNRSEVEISVSSWQLLRLSGDIINIHEFGRQAKIKARGTVTVWSSDAIDRVHDPPYNIVMNGQKWCTSGHFKTVLTNSSGEEEAVRETRYLPVGHRKCLTRLHHQPKDLKLTMRKGGFNTQKCVIS